VNDQRLELQIVLDKICVNWKYLLSKRFITKNLAIRVSLPYHIRKWSSSPIRQLCGF
jgi:hypothetical protein